MSESHEDGYAGPAELIDGDSVTPVEVTLAGHFDPISGKYRWYGRVAAAPEVSALLEAGGRNVRLRTPQGEVETSLSDVDPWGRPRVEGFGAAPFEVLTGVAEDAG
jgi:Domain of unknown function (DUF4873)